MAHRDVTNVDLNKLGEKPPIPEMPSTEAELDELMKKYLEIVFSSDPTNEYGGKYVPGNIAHTYIIMRCPFCNMLFSGHRREGCFGGSISPHNCPNCSFPSNVLHKMIELDKESRNIK